MGKILFIIGCILSFLGSNIYAQEEWTWISQPGETLYIVDKDVSFFFYNWPSGSHGSTSFIEKSDDGGHSYSVIRERTGEWGCYYMTELFFLDADTGFFAEACAGTVIYKTTNGGDSWSPAGMSGPYRISMFFLREDYGYYTTEGGGTSTYFLFRNGEIIFDTPDYIFANEHFYFPWPSTELYFKNDSTGLIICKDRLENAVIIKTSDYGITWTEKLSIPGGKFNDMIFTAGNRGFVAGNAGVLLMTDDFGESWDTLNIPSSQDLNSIDFSDDGTGYIAANAGTLLRSTDEGLSWDLVQAPSGSDLIYTRVFEDDHTFVLTEEGDLYSNRDNSGIEEHQREEITIYPNPAINELYILMPDGIQTRENNIFHLDGRLLHSSRELKISLNNFSRGVYLLEVKTDQGTHREKFIKQ